jgi:hypothetical protein
MNNASLEAKLVAAYRALNPRSRVTSLIKLVRNGSTVKQYGCVLCGKEGPTYSGKYPETKRSRAWRIDHVAAHVANYEVEIVALDARLEGHADKAADVLAEVRS